MKLTEFINNFANTHEIQTIDDLQGTIITALTSDEYLVSIKEITQK